MLRPPGQDTEALLADCDARLARYQAALDAGADPKAVSEWTRQVEAERTAVLARAASHDHHKPARQLTEDDIRALITGLGDLRDVATGSASATSTRCQLGNRLARILVLTIPGQPAVVTHWLAPGPRNPEGLRPASGRASSM